MDLDEGENHFAIRVYQGVDDFGEFYRLTITREPGPPDAPQHLNVSPHDSGALDLYWEAPPSDGGSEITGYRVQWKEAAHSWDAPADVSEETVTGTTHTITGLTDGVEYAIRVIATNDVGDGPPSEDATGSPRETTPPELATAKVDGATLTLTFDEALDGDSEPALDAFSVTVGGAERTVKDVSVAGSEVTLTLASAVTAEDTVAVSYTVPTDDAAPRIRDLAGNAAPSFTGREVTNDTEGAVEPPTVSPEGESNLRSYITVVVAADGEDSTSFSVTWEDAGDCSQDYTAKLDHWKTTTILGTAASGGALIEASVLNDSLEHGLGYHVSVFCNAGSGRSVSSVGIHEVAGLPAPGTHSSEPALTALGVSPGALAPGFHRHTLEYAVEELPGGGNRLTLDMEAKDGYKTVVVKGDVGDSMSCRPGCKMQYQLRVDGAYVGSEFVDPSSDADADAPGFQLDLEGGETHFAVHAYPEGRFNMNRGRLYRFGVLRPVSTDATLSGLTLSGVNFGNFDPATTGYAASVANGVDETTVTPTVNDGGATYTVKLGGEADADGIIPLSVGSNTITIEVTAGDGNTAKTYTVTVTRAAPSASGPAVAIELSPSGAVDEGTEITVTMSFTNLESNSDTSDTDYIFRADVVDADACEGGGMGIDRYMYKVDEDPEVRTGTISAACPVGGYTVRASISSPGNVELAHANANFTVVEPGPPLSTDATLSGLALSGVTLAFDPATTGYTASVANEVSQTTVTPTTNDGGATYAIKLDGMTDADGVIPLTVGSNVITVEVTAEDGQTTRTYTVTVTRAAATPEITIRPLTEEEWNNISPRQSVSIALSPSGEVEPGTEITVTMSFGGLEQDADTATKDYIFRADVVGADQCEDQGGGYGLGVERYMYKVDEDPEVRTGTIPSDCPAGDYTVKASISSPDSVELALASTNFTVLSLGQQQRESEPLSTDATLSGLALSGVNIGAYDPPTTEYTAHVGNDVTATTVTATTNDDGAAYVVKLNGAAENDGTVTLAVGENDITIVVTAEDGQTSKTYTVTVTRAAPPSTDATLSGLALSDVTLAFASTTTAYTASVANDVAETTVTPTTNDDGATYVVKLDGAADDDGVIPLAVGSNVITIEVTAEDGQTTRTYTITITRAAPPAPGPVATFELSPSGPVEPGAVISVTMFFANLEFDSDASDTDYIFRGDVLDSNGADADACEDQAGGYGLGVERYMYKVDEDPEVRAGTISASCAPGDYTVEVSISSPGNVELASATAGFTVTAPAEQQQAQEPPPSTDATLSSLALSDVTLAFGSTTTGYTASVANDVDETTVTPMTNDDEATYEIKLGGVSDADGVIPLAVGGNVITVEVTAEDGETTKTYTVTVTRAAPPPSSDAALSILTLSGVTLAFSSATTEYTASVGNDVGQTTVTPTVNDGGATYVIKLDGVADDEVIPLSVGGNVITIEVTAEDGETTRTYTVTVTRAALPLSTDATLSGLALSDIGIGAFDPATTGYTAEVANDVTETRVTPTVNDGATYAIKLNGVADDEVIPLSVGGNVITIEVTAEDGETTRTYTVTVTRAKPDAVAVVSLSPSGPVEQGTEIAVTMTFANLTMDDNANLTFRADVVGSDACEGQGIGVTRNMNKVDEDPEVRTGTISANCPAGDHTLEVSLTSTENVDWRRPAPSSRSPNRPPPTPR